MKALLLSLALVFGTALATTGGEGGGSNAPDQPILDFATTGGEGGGSNAPDQPILDFA